MHCEAPDFCGGEDRHRPEGRRLEDRRREDRHLGRGERHLGRGERRLPHRLRHPVKYPWTRVSRLKCDSRGQNPTTLR